MDTELDRAWTSTVASHVESCGHLLEFCDFERSFSIVTDSYMCRGCCQVLTKEDSIKQSVTDRARQRHHAILKKAALGIPLQGFSENITVRFASQKEIDASLEEDPKTKMMMVEVDREWTHTVAKHALKCGNNLEFVSAEQNGYELVDHYHCNECDETLTKRGSRDVVSPLFTQNPLLKDELNRSSLKNLAKADTMTVLDCYNFSFMADMWCPTLEEMNEAIADLKQESQKRLSCSAPACKATCDCENITFQQCPCKELFYCSKSCQASHWKTHHKKSCSHFAKQKQQKAKKRKEAKMARTVSWL